MEFIARERFNKTVTTEDLVNALEQLGYSVFLEKKPALTDEERHFATQKLFSEPEVSEQLRNAKANRDPEFSAYSGDEGEFAKLMEKMNGRS